MCEKSVPGEKEWNKNVKNVYPEKNSEKECEKNVPGKRGVKINSEKNVPGKRIVKQIVKKMYLEK